ncbi:hypothetical protein NKG05_02825 [Oerskovia sp. M15]
MFHVPGHEPRPARAGRALGLHVQPQLRGSPGQGWAHPPGLAARRSRDGHPRDAVLAGRPGPARRRRHHGLRRHPLAPLDPRVPLQV